MSIQGFINEDEMKVEIDGKKVSQLNKNIKAFIIDIFDIQNKKDLNKIVLCKKKGGQNKGDVEISIGDKTKMISIKMGTGNSVHQEPVEDFIKYLNINFKSEEDISNELRLFIWGDQTLDGTGKVEDRISASKFKEKYPDVVKKIQKYFHQFKADLIQRFVLNGKDNDLSIDYIYYGNKDCGKWVSSKKLLTWLSHEDNVSNGAISVGALTFQAWNRNINGGDRSENKRGVIQLKWGTMGDDIMNI